MATANTVALWVLTGLAVSLVIALGIAAAIRGGQGPRDDD